MYKYIKIGIVNIIINSRIKFWVCNRNRWSKLQELLKKMLEYVFLSDLWGATALTFSRQFSLCGIPTWAVALENNKKMMLKITVIKSLRVIELFFITICFSNMSSVNCSVGSIGFVPPVKKNRNISLIFFCCKRFDTTS